MTIRYVMGSLLLCSSCGAAAASYDTRAREGQIKAIFNCTVRADSRLADKVVAGPSMSKEARVLAKRLVGKMTPCMVQDPSRGAILQMNGLLIRGELARSQLSRSHVATQTYSPPVIHPDSLPQNRAAADAEIIVTSFAGCLAKKSPEAAATFVAADTGTAAERQAFSQLRPHIEGCQVEASDYQISGDRLRAGLAIMLYSSRPTSSPGTAK